MFLRSLVIALTTFNLAARAEDAVEPLRRALEKMAEAQNGWAYTETTHVEVSRGKSPGDMVFRFDPSKPYRDQFLPIKINGRAPTPKEIEEFKRRGEDRAARLVNDSDRGEHRPDEARIYINGQFAWPDLDHAVVTTESAQDRTYRIPLLTDDGKTNELLRKFELTADVNKNSGEFDRAALTLLKPMRVKLVAKVNDLLLRVDFIHPGEATPALIGRLDQTGNVSMFFIHARVHATVTRADFEKVKPYSDGANVRIGPARAIEF